MSVSIGLCSSRAFRIVDRADDRARASMVLGIVHQILESPYLRMGGFLRTFHIRRGWGVEGEQCNTALGVLGLLRRDVVDADDVLVEPGGHLGLRGVPREATEQEGVAIVIRSSKRTI